MKLLPWLRKRETDEPRSETGHEMDLFRGGLESWPRLFSSPWPFEGLDRTFGALTTPSIGMSDDENEVTVTMELPGVEPADVDIRISGTVLTVSGEKREERSDRRESYTERRYGGFRRTVQLPSSIDPDKVDATFRNGVLTLKVAKCADARPKRIKVRHA